MKAFNVWRSAFGVRRGKGRAPARSGVEHSNRTLSNRTAGSRSNSRILSFMDVLRRIARERVPTAPTLNAER